MIEVSFSQDGDVRAWSVNDYVLAGRLPGDELCGTSRFGDETWRLGHAERLGHVPNLSLYFARVPSRFRPVAKELFAQLLNDDLAPRGRVYAVSSIRHYFTGVVAFLDFLDRKGISKIGDAAPVQLAEFVGYLSGRRRLNQSHLRSARLFWLYRSRLSDSMQTDPESISFWRTAPEPERHENTTARIPEAVLEPLIWWSSKFVDDFADDILRAQTDHLTLLQARDLRAVKDRTMGEGIARVLDLLDRYQGSGQPLPGHHSGRSTGRPNYRALDREAGVPTGSTIRMADYKVRALAEINGVDSDTFLPTELSGTMLGKKWKERITYREVPALCKLLQTACYIIVAFYSGMRDSEVKHIKRGCIEMESDDTGQLIVHVLNASTFKGNQESNGKSARWVVSPAVVRAVAVLERLAPDEDEYLFKPIRKGTSHDRPGTKDLVSSSETTSGLSNFVDWVNSRASSDPGTPAIPDINGKRWNLTSRQFRRTLAWFIARQPGGMAAGALQYKHLSLQMFRGYAGESDSGFAEELAAQQALARGEWLGGLAAEADSVVGRSKDEVLRRLDVMGEALGFAGSLPDSPAQLVRLLKRHDPYIYRGSAVTCAFDPSKALCMRREPNAPEFQSCEPLKCANAVFTPEDVLAWRNRARDLATVAADESRAPRLRVSAADHAARLLKFFDSVEAAK